MCAQFSCGLARALPGSSTSKTHRHLAIHTHTPHTLQHTHPTTHTAPYTAHPTPYSAHAHTLYNTYPYCTHPLTTHTIQHTHTPYTVNTPPYPTPLTTHTTPHTQTPRRFPHTPPRQSVWKSGIKREVHFSVKNSKIYPCEASSKSP